jgi:hypothetical protein
LSGGRDPSRWPRCGDRFEEDLILGLAASREEEQRDDDEGDGEEDVGLMTQELQDERRAGQDASDGIPVVERQQARCFRVRSPWPLPHAPRRFGEHARYPLRPFHGGGRHPRMRAASRSAARPASAARRVLD